MGKTEDDGNLRAGEEAVGDSTERNARRCGGWISGFVDEVIFLRRHTVVSNRHSLTVHPTVDEITLEGTHHGPITSKPTMFLEIGSTEDYWKRQAAAQVMALLMWEGLGLGTVKPVRRNFFSGLEVDIMLLVTWM